MEDQLAVLRRWLVGRGFGDVELLIGNIWSWLTRGSGHGGDQDVVDKQGQTGDWMPRHLRLVPLADEDGQSISWNLHVPQFALGPDAEDDCVSSEIDVEVRRRENVGIVESGQELVNGGDCESLVTRLRVQEARGFVIGL